MSLAGHRRRRAAVDLSSLVLGVLWVSSAFAGSAAPALPRGIPSNERVELVELARTADVATNVEAESFVIRQDIFEYLLDHPEFAAHLARALRYTSLRIWNTPEGLFLDDGHGVMGHFRVVYAANGTRVFHAKGRYKKALLPPIYGEALTLIEFDAVPVGNGRILVRPGVSGWVRLDNRVAALGLRVASSVAQIKADREARKLTRLFAKASRAIDEDPALVWGKLSQQPDVPPRELQEFGRLLNVR